MRWQILTGDVRTMLAHLPDQSVQTVITSPPYWGLRDYGTASWDGGDPACDHTQGRPGSGRADGIVDDRAQRNRDGVGAMGGDCRQCGAKRIDQQLGLELTPDLYVDNLVSVFRGVWRVLRDDGTVWLNLGDSYAAARGGTCMPAETLAGGVSGHGDATEYSDPRRGRIRHAQRQAHRDAPSIGLKHKDLVGIPWRVAFALQADGWWLRSDIIWSKPNPMPESVTDRPTKAHEYLFLLTKAERYYYDADAIAEDAVMKPQARLTPRDFDSGKDAERAAHRRPDYRIRETAEQERAVRNKRSVWIIPTQPYPEAHFATFPEDLVTPCVLAGSKPGDLVLDPFCGSGTTGAVAIRLQRNFVGVELNSQYVQLARARIDGAAPLFAQEIDA